MKGLCSSLLAACALVLCPVGSALAQPAQGLTEFRVVAVASPQYLGGQFWDKNVAPGAIATQSEHGGSWLRVVVFERGYATGSNASFNGARMQLYHSEALYGFDRKVYGWNRYYYIATPFTGGRFTSSAISIANPWGTKSTAINIR